MGALQWQRNRYSHAPGQEKTGSRCRRSYRCWRNSAQTRTDTARISRLLRLARKSNGRGRTMLESNSSGKSTGSGRKEAAVRDWVRIPDKTKVRYRLEDHRGAVDGLTEMVTGVKRNPDGRTQYRIDIGQPQRLLAAEEDLVIL